MVSLAEEMDRQDRPYLLDVAAHAALTAPFVFGSTGPVDARPLVYLVDTTIILMVI